MKCDIAATAVALSALRLCATYLAPAAAAEGSPRVVGPEASDASSVLGSISEEAAASEAVATPAGGDGVGLLSLTCNGHEFKAFIPRNATEKHTLSLVKKGCDEGGATDPNEAVALTGVLISMKHGYDRTRYWFELGGARTVFDTFLESLVLVAQDRPLSVLEIGSFEGGSAIWFAHHLLKHPLCRMVCVDTWEGSPEIVNVEMSSVEDRFRRNMLRTGKGGHIHAIQGDSLLSLSGLVAAGQSSSFDVVYVDASHSMADALADCLLSFRLLKVGGIMIVDDETNFPGVPLATAAIELALGEGLQVLYRKDQVVARKISDRWASSGLVALVEHGYETVENLSATAPREWSR